MATEQPASKVLCSRSAAHDKPLRESLEDASVLLWYATREGKPVSKKTVDDIVTAQNVLSEKRHDAEVEAKFWIAFRDLAMAILPVSVDSILATYSYPFGDHSRPDERSTAWPSWWPRAGRRRRLIDAASTKRWYSIGSMIVLGCLLIVQIYWFIGTNLRTDLEAHRAELDRIAGSLRELAPAVKTAQAMFATKGMQLDMIKAQGAYGPSDGASESAAGQSEVARVTGDIEHLQNEQSRLILESANLTRRGSRVVLMLQGDSAMLAWWDVFTDIAGLNHEEADAGAHAREIAEAIPVSGDPNNTAQGLDLAGNLEAEIVKIENALVDDQLKVELALLNSKSTLDILSQYVLPLLYGLLGSLAYILRTLSREIQNVTFTRGSEIRYSLRWPLGMLGGVTVGLFFDPAELTGFAAVTPLGLAFLAGYGVELLFTGLDRMVSAFAGDGSERPRTA